MKKRLPLLWLWLLIVCVLPISQVRAQIVRADTWTWARNLGMQGEARVAATSRAGFYATGRQWQRRLWEHDTLPKGSYDRPISYLIRHADRDAASWVRILPGASRDVAADERGNVYVLGAFEEPTPPAAPAPTPAGPGIVPPPTAHRQVLRYDSQGQLRGDLKVAGDVVAFAVNGRGQLAVLHCLAMPPPAALPSDSAAQARNSVDDERRSLHLSCFGPDGQQQWTRLVTDTYASLSDLGNPSPDHQRAVGIDRQGRVWLTGSFGGTLNRSAGRFVVDTAHTSTSFLLGYGWHGQLARALPLPHTAPTALAVTPAGTVYLVGRADSAAAPLPDRRQPPGSGSRLQCRSASGGLRWVSTVPWDATALALDRRGRAYVLGNKEAETTDSSGWLVAARGRRGPDVWVGRYSRRGRLQRTLRGTGLNDETGTSLAVDGAGAGWVAGRISPYPLEKEPCTSFGAYAFDTEQDYAQDLHLVYDSVGQTVASRRISPLPSPNYEQLRADKTINPDDYDPGARHPENYELAQAACRESHHSPQFTDRYASHYRLRGRGLSLSAPVVADAAGNSYALCALEGETALKGLATPLVDQSPDAPDGVLLKYGPGGRLRWARQLAATSPEVALNQLAVDGQGNVFVLGRAKGQAALGGHPLGPLWRQARQPVLAKYDSVGRLAWLRTDQLGLDSRCTLSALAPDGRGGLYGVGWS